MRTLAILTLTLLLLSCKGGDVAPTLNMDVKNVIIIVVDTLRADQMNMYSKEPLLTTPFLDTFAEQCVVFDEAYTVRSLTRPSFTALFTGQHPIYTGVYDNKVDWLPDQHSLVEDFQSAGFHTVCIPAQNVIGSEHGLSAGFDEYYDVTGQAARYYDDIGYEICSPDTKREPSNAIIPAVLAENNERLFLVIHLWECHSPYEAPDEFLYKVDGDMDYEGPVDGSVESLQDALPWSGDNIYSYDDLGYARDLYRAQIRWTDSNIEDIIQRIKDAGMYDNSLIVVMADHGEALGERFRFFHGLDTEEELHIPLMMHFPMQDFQVRVPGLLETCDVLPTIADVTHIPIPQVHGYSHKQRIIDPAIPGIPLILSIGATNDDGSVYFSTWDGVWRPSFYVIDQEMVMNGQPLSDEELSALEALGYI